MAILERHQDAVRSLRYTFMASGISDRFNQERV